MNYTPRIDEQAWTPIRDFIYTAVAACAGKTAYADHDLYQASTGLASWARSATDLPLSEELFAPSAIEDFVRRGLPAYSPASRGNRRSILLRMSEAILGERASRVRLESLPSSTPSKPYSDRELRGLRDWALRSSTSRRPRAFALLGLGVGAGLSTGEITAALCADVRETESGLTISVRGQRARTVTISPEWAEAVREAIDGGSAGDWIFCPDRTTGGKNMVTNFLAPDRSAAVNVQRMRATWIVRQLREGAPAVQLMRDAGVSRMTALSRFVPFVDAA
ncbi:integrase [Conyzicola nivalis]|uniref:Integrase n=1 Tax=Conyzicola nivalis TaxID=1477021 RepID=A0ABV2QRR8_9MICO